jgi:O-antigen ligase
VPLAVVLLSVALSPESNWLVGGALAGFCILAIARPDAALLASIAMIGIAPVLAVLSGARTMRVSEVLVVGVLAGCGVRALPSGSPVRRALSESTSIAVILLAGTAVASAIVWLRIEQIQFGYAETWVRELLRYASRDYFVDASHFGLVLSTVVLLEGLALYVVAAALCRVDATFFERALRMLVVGGAALAAMSAVRLAEMTLRNPAAVEALRASPGGLRISPQIPDYIAAGSYFALCWLAATGIAIASRHRLAWVATGVPLVGALYLTGSRSVILSALAALVALVLFLRRRQLAASRGILVFTALALAAMVIAYPWVSGRDLAGELAQRSLMVRVELMRIGLQLIESRPLFGVGLDRFFLLAGSLASPELHAAFPARLNPHNDFIRFGAELGLIGLGLFLWILWAAARRIRQALSRNADPSLAGLAGGLAAFLITSLVSNPLMVRPVSYVFWIALGLAVGRSSTLAPAEGPTARRPTVAAFSDRVRAWRIPIALLLGAVLVLSIPFRVRQEIAGVDLSRVSYGLMDWGTNPDGTPARRTGARATMFVRGRARVVEIPLGGTLPSGGPQEVQVWLNGRLANRVTVGAEWQRVRLVLSPDPPLGSHRIDLFVSPTWVPAEVVGNDDRRVVGVKIGALHVPAGLD